MAGRARWLTQDEEVLRAFRPHGKVLLPVLWWGMLLAAVAGGAWAAFGSDWLGWIVLVAVVTWSTLSLRRILRWRWTAYLLTTERLVVRTGMVARRGTELPLENITNVVFDQGVLQRLLGYGDVLIESAGSQGQSRFVDIPDPESFQAEVYRARELRNLRVRGATRGGSRDVVSQLEALAELRERGHLDDEEFARSKRRLLEDLPGIDGDDLDDLIDEGRIDPML